MHHDNPPERDPHKGTKVVLAVGVLGLLALALFGGRGAGVGGGDPGSGGSAGGGGMPGSKPPLELFPGGDHIRTKAGLQVWGPLGSQFGWLADPNEFLKNVKAITLVDAGKGSQDMVETFLDWVKKYRPDIEVGIIDP